MVMMIVLGISVTTAYRITTAVKMFSVSLNHLLFSTLGMEVAMKKKNLWNFWRANSLHLPNWSIGAKEVVLAPVPLVATSRFDYLTLFSKMTKND